MMLKDILAQISAQVGKNPPSIRLSLNLILPLAYLMEFWVKLKGSGQPRGTVDGVPLRLSMKKMLFSSRRAQEKLGYTYRPVEKAFQDTIDWFQMG